MWIPILYLTSLFVYSAAETPEQLDAISTSNPAVQQKILEAISECRREVDPPAKNMVKPSWSVDAQKTAEKWAKTCACKHSEAAQRQIPGHGCGENIAMNSSYTTWEVVIKAFCDERKLHKYGFANLNQTGHYTQLCCYNSHMVGASVSHCPTGEYKYFFVVHMCPAGNTPKLAAEPYEQGPSCAACPNHCDNKQCTNPCPHGNNVTNCNDFANRCDHPIVQKSCEGMCKCVNGEII